MTSKHFRASNNIFDNEEPQFESENVHYSLEYMYSVLPESPSTWCYKIERAIVDDKPTSHYAVCYWKNKWGLSKQHFYFVDVSEPLEGLWTDEFIKDYLKKRDLLNVHKTGFINLGHCHYANGGAYVWVTPQYAEKFLAFIGDTPHTNENGVIAIPNFTFWNNYSQETRNLTLYVEEVK